MAESHADFVRGYCERSGITEAKFYEWKVALPCKCQESPEPHWAAVIRDAAAICDHLAFNCPNTGELIAMGSVETKLYLAGTTR